MNKNKEKTISNINFLIQLGLTPFRLRSLLLMMHCIVKWKILISYILFTHCRVTWYIQPALIWQWVCYSVRTPPRRSWSHAELLAMLTTQSKCVTDYMPYLSLRLLIRYSHWLIFQKQNTFTVTVGSLIQHELIERTK